MIDIEKVIINLNNKIEINQILLECLEIINKNKYPK